MDYINLNKGYQKIDCSLSENNEIQLNAVVKGCFVTGLPVPPIQGFVMYLRNVGGVEVTLSNNYQKADKESRFKIGADYILKPYMGIYVVYNNQWEIK